MVKIFFQNARFMHIFVRLILVTSCFARKNKFTNAYDVTLHKKEILTLLETILVLQQEEIQKSHDSNIYFQLGLAQQLLASKMIHITDEDNSDADLFFSDDVAFGKHLQNFKIPLLLDKSEIAYRRCLRLDPTHPDALTNLGKLLSDQSPAGGKNPEIAQLYQRAIQTSPSHYQSHVNLALWYHKHKIYDNAIKAYSNALYYHPNSVELHYNFAVALRDMGSIKKSVYHYERVIDLDKYHVAAGINLSAMHHLYGTLDDAIYHYRRVLQIFFEKMHETCINLPFDFQDQFMFLHNEIMCGSKSLIYSMFISYHPLNQHENILDSNTNHNTLHGAGMEYLSTALNDGCFRGQLKRFIMILTNLGQALTQRGFFNEGMTFHFLVNILIQLNIGWLMSHKKNSHEVMKSQKLLIREQVLLFQSAKSGCKWMAWEWLDGLVENIISYEFNESDQSSFLPFDTLSLPLPSLWKKKVAIRHAQYSHPTDESKVPSFPIIQTYKSEMPLRLGFLSYDFNDHPTAHLSEGLFFWNNITDTKVKFAAYNYGKNDNSTFRKNIEAYLGGNSNQGGSFFDFGGLSYDNAVNLIRNDQPQIVFDLQAFTRGSRPEILAKRVAPIQVNYLVLHFIFTEVYPGTSGASFIDYIVADKYVIPPEHAKSYTEKIILLPRSYQINHYRLHSYSKAFKRGNIKKFHNSEVDVKRYNNDPIIRGSEEWKLLRIEAGLDPSYDIFVFTNFNKQEKLEPLVFSVWMQILSQVPNSVLWLLEPSKRDENKESSFQLLNELRMAASAAGIKSSRILFAPRVSKELHLKRSAAADIFLDSFIYGAHSTCTDSLMAGLPMLTLTGDHFASRVATSLLRYAELGIDDVLVAYSIKDYTNIAVSMARDCQMHGFETCLLSRVRHKLAKGIHESNLLNGELYLEEFVRLSKSLWEVQIQHESVMNIVIP